MRALAFALVLGSATVAVAQAPENTSAPPPPAYQTTVHARPKRDDGSPQIVMTARELKERGAQTLADALALIPEVQVRQGGNGIRVDVRGAKQFSVMLLIDGVPVSEPYFGIYDVSSIPVTDIVEIRVQLAPASPLEGPGGDGGIIEVMTLRALGSKLVNARVVGGSMPEGEAALTGRTTVGDSGTFGVRASAGARIADPTYPVTSAVTGTRARFSDFEDHFYGSLRLEYAGLRAHTTGDLFYGHRSFYIPPSDTTGNLLQHVTGEDSVRAVVGTDVERQGLRVAVGVYGELLSRLTDEFTDYTLSTLEVHQDLVSGRFGGAVQVDRPFAVRSLVGTLSARLSVDTDAASVHDTVYLPNVAPSTTGAWLLTPYGELAVGGKLRWRWLSAEAAIGALVPFENASATWPDAKVVVGFHPHRMLTINLIGARKGRLPTVRELIDPLQGNQSLKPEQTWHGELQLALHPNRFVAARFSGYVRQIDGLIRLDPVTMHNTNLGLIDVRGLETGVDLLRDQPVGLGGTYIFEDAYSADPGLLFDAVPNFPRHRIDVYLSSTWRRRLGGLVRFDWTDSRVVQQTRLGSYYVMELDLWARIWKTLRASVRIDNLTNNSYLVLPGLSALPTTVTATVEGSWP
ncbi:MAG TPA: TonB-dependent receptor [Polyangia bacterium]